MKKIISGSETYVSRVCRNFYILGWTVTKQRKWSDGTLTITMEKRK